MMCVTFHASDSIATDYHVLQVLARLAALAHRMHELTQQLFLLVSAETRLPVFGYLGRAARSRPEIQRVASSRSKPQVLQRAAPKVEIDTGVNLRTVSTSQSLTFKKHAQVIVLVTADSDFIPAMKPLEERARSSCSSRSATGSGTA
jgi:hypothetical protein